MRSFAVSSRFAWPPDRCMNILSRDSHSSKSFIVRSIRSCRFAGSMSNIEAWNLRIEGLVTPETPRLLKRYSHNLSDLGPLLHNINPNNFCRSGCWLQDRAKDHQKCCLAG